MIPSETSLRFGLCDANRKRFASAILGELSSLEVLSPSDFSSYVGEEKTH